MDIKNVNASVRPDQISQTKWAKVAGGAMREHTGQLPMPTVVETDIVSWLQQYDLAEKGQTAQPYRLQYEWLRAMARNRHNALSLLKLNYRKEAQRRAARHKALQYAAVQEAGITADMLPTYMFKHTTLEKVVYAVQVLYQSVLAAATLMFVLAANKAMQSLSRLGFHFTPARDAEDVRYQEWVKANPGALKAIALQKQRWSEYNVFWGEKSEHTAFGTPTVTSVPTDEQELVCYLDTMVRDSENTQILKKYAIRSEIRKIVEDIPIGETKK